jgi:outer membrane lipoprotein SlyB
VFSGTGLAVSCRIAGFCAGNASGSARILREKPFMNARTYWARIGRPVAGIAAVVALLGLAIAIIRGQPGIQPGTAAPAAGPVSIRSCAICGAIVSIRILEVRDESAENGSGAGVPAGLQAGVRHGDAEASSSTTILGYSGGAFAAGEPVVKKRPAYRVTVRMDDGSFRTVSLSSPPAFAVGDKVRVVEGKLARG